MIGPGVLHWRTACRTWALIRPAGTFSRGEKGLGKRISMKLLGIPVAFFASARVAEWSAGIFRLTIAAAAVLVTGCGSESPKPQDGRASTASVNEADECRRKLGTAIERIQPESLAVQTRREMVVNGLNSWLASCAESEVEAMKVSDGNAALLSAAALRTAGAVRFTENDIGYIRDCLLLKSLTESIWKQADAQVAAASGASGDKTASDTERVVALFRYLMRNIALLPSEDLRVPVGIYEVLMTGRGSVDDRIWVFAEALRQRQLDAILIRASSPGDPVATDAVAAADLLMGVVAEGRLLLFDPVRGTAVPRSGDATVLVTDPAGLEALAGHDRWKTAATYVICHPSAAAPRMLVLQERLEATDSAILYEELVGGTSEIHPLQSRVGEVVSAVWPAGGMKIWEVPEQRIAAAASLTEEQKQSFSLLMRPFDSPFERESLVVDDDDLVTDPNIDQTKLSMEEKMNMKLEALAKRMERSDDLFGKPSRRLLNARLTQILGNNEVDMIQDLQQIRIACMQEKIELQIKVDAKQAMVLPPIPLPKAILDVQRSAVGDTLYWTALCQMARNDMGVAVATLRNYRKQYPDEKTVLASMINEAEALIQIGDTKSAATTLAMADVDHNPDRPRVRWLLSRLGATGASSAAELPANQTPAAEVPTPTLEKPATDPPAATPEADAKAEATAPDAAPEKPAAPADSKTPDESPESTPAEEPVTPQPDEG